MIIMVIINIIIIIIIDRVVASTSNFVISRGRQDENNEKIGNNKKKRIACIAFLSLTKLIVPWCSRSCQYWGLYGVLAGTTATSATASPQNTT